MRPRLTIAGLLMGMAVAATARADIKLAFVDVQRALNECRRIRPQTSDLVGDAPVVRPDDHGKR